VSDVQILKRTSLCCGCSGFCAEEKIISHCIESDVLTEVFKISKSLQSRDARAVGPQSGPNLSTFACP
jgi:hypothetical protein